MLNVTDEISEFVVKNKKPYDLTRFQALVKDIGSQFKTKVEACIHFIEMIQREQACELEEQLTDRKAKKGPKVSNTIVQKFVKDTKAIPALVFSIEKYDLAIISLSKNTDVNLLVGTKLSASRDFRIAMNAFKKRAGGAAATSFNSNVSRPVNATRAVDADDPDEEEANQSTNTPATGKRKRARKRKSSETTLNEK